MSYAQNYSFVDRALHQFAFSAPFVQRLLAELENDLFRNQLEHLDPRNEVFVTGLPRAGTTLLLEMLYNSGGFAALTYRDMPFVLAPLIWNRLSRHFRQSATRMERAHGDGMEVSYDSPEAFEEVVWLAYLRTAILGQRTLHPLTTNQLTEEFSAAMRGFVRKVVRLGWNADGKADPPRYLSKNNANISRLELLSELFPTSSILVVFRHPATHVASLSHQHARFSGEHAEDAFSRRYMAWIGHHEFGANLRPIDFDHWLEGRNIPDPVDDTFWMEYWIAAYTHVLQHRTPNVHLVDFDLMLAEGGARLERIAHAIGLDRKQEFVAGAASLRSPKSTPLQRSDTVDPRVWEHANALHARLRAAAL